MGLDLKILNQFKNKYNHTWVVLVIMNICSRLLKNCDAVSTANLFNFMGNSSIFKEKLKKINKIPIRINNKFNN